MTTITINSESFDAAQINSGSTIHEVVGHIMTNTIDKNSVITSITIDGQKMDINKDKERFTQPINSFQSIDFFVQSRKDMIINALSSCAEYIDVINENIAELSQLYAQNLLADANNKFGEIIEHIDFFVKLMAQIKNTIRNHFPTTIKESAIIQTLELHLTAILKSLVPAKEKDDIIMLSDLLEYELVDNLNQWKEKGIPELQNLKE